jgi:serine/threonine-protein kinase
MGESSSESSLQTIGRYVLCDVIASGGMAKVHLGRLLGPAGFSRIVAIKQLHPHLAQDEEFAAMFLDEARLAAKIRHPNVVPTLDIARSGDELLLVMEYVHGEALSGLIRTVIATGSRVSVPIATAIMVGVLNGLHAAHEVTDERGKPLHVVHRDVSPQNVLVGTDGIARVTDFGVAKARGRSQSTGDSGRLKGKLAYMAPEQFRHEPTTARVDIYAAALVFWELLSGRRRFRQDNDAGIVSEILYGTYPSVRTFAPEVSTELDEVIAKGMSRDPNERHATAGEMALAIERCLRPASHAEVGSWVREVARATLERRDAMLAAMESDRPSGAHARRAATKAEQAVVDPTDVHPREPTPVTAVSPDAEDKPTPSGPESEHGATIVRRSARAWLVGAGGALVVLGGSLVVTLALLRPEPRSLAPALADPSPPSPNDSPHDSVIPSASVSSIQSAAPAENTSPVAIVPTVPTKLAPALGPTARAKPAPPRASPAAPRLPRRLPGERN